MLETTSTGPFCETWNDHEFDGGRVVTTGNHPIRGRYEVVRVRCRRCARTIDETRWLQVPPRYIPRQREEDDEQ